LVHAPIEALLIGLGNPGPECSDNRHNIGFMVADVLAARAGLRFERLSWIWTATGEFCGKCVLLLKPRTLMNRSGRAVGAALETLAAEGCEPPIDSCLVIHDDLDLPFATLRLKRGGGHGGHKGLRSIIGAVGPDFARLRIGIDHPGPGADVSDYVLSDFSSTEQAVLGALVERAADAAVLELAEGLEAAMNLVNARDPEA